jgi:FxLD family lantipeptide
MNTAMLTVPATDSEADPDFDLDVSIVESGPVVSDLMRSTDDGCNSTCGTACTSCRS